MNEERYRALVEAIATFVWVANPAGEFASPQQGWEDYTGHNFEQHGGDRWIQDVHPGDRARVAETWAGAVAGKSWYEVEWRCWHGATRRWRQCVTRGVPVLNPDGSVREWVGAVTDIEHRLDPGQVFEREWLRMAQSAGGLALWEWSSATGDARWTSALYQLYGVPAGSARREMDGRIHPEDREAVLAARAAAAVSGALDVTFRIVRPSVGIRWLRSKGFTVPGRQSPKIVGVSVDVTDLINLRESYRAQAGELETLIDAIPACVWISRDPECRVITGNRAANEFLNASPCDSSDGPHAIPMRLVCASGAALRGEEIAFVSPDGTTRHLLGNAIPLLDAAEKVRGCVAVFLDVTELKRVQQEALRSNRELVFANQQLSHFNFAASHDLREPMREVALFSELLITRLGGRLDPDCEMFLQFCRRGALRMQELLDGLLAYAQVAEHPLPLTHPAASREALEKALENLANPIEREHAVIEAEGELPLVLVEPSCLMQVFQNLLSNAIKYRGPDPPRIHVSAARDGDFWCFTVRDNGIGIDPEYHEKIFGIFQRLHSRATYEGTGIGLAICQRIVERYGGDIWVESSAGKGCTFYFTLPAG